MSCEGHRAHYFNQVHAYAPEIDPANLETLYETARNRPAQKPADELLAEAKTRLLFADMQAEGIKPPTHSPSGLPKKDARLGYAAVYDHLQSKGFFLIEGRDKKNGNGAHAPENTPPVSGDDAQAAVEADSDMRQELPQDKIDRLAGQNLAGVRLSGADEEDAHHSARFPIWQYIPRCAKCGRFMATHNPVCQNPNCGLHGKKQHDPIDWPPAGAFFKKTPTARPADWQANRALPKAAIRIRKDGAEKDVVLERVSPDRKQVDYVERTFAAGQVIEQRGTVDRAEVTQWEGQPAKRGRKKHSPTPPPTPPPASAGNDTEAQAPFVSVTDVYGHRHRVKKADLDQPDKTMLPLYNQNGERLDDEHGKTVTVLHRGNIAPAPEAGVVENSLPDAELPKYIVEKGGQIVQVVGWDGEKPKVIYPGEDGGRNPQTGQPFEYTLHNRGQWRPASDDDFEARFGKRIPATSRTMLGAWRDDLRQMNANQTPDPVAASPDATDINALVNPKNTWAKLGQRVRRKDTGEEFIVSGFGRTQDRKGISASLDFADGSKGMMAVDLAMLELVEDVSPDVPLFQFPEVVLHPVHTRHMRDWQDEMNPRRVGKPAARPKYRPGDHDDALIAAAKASLYHHKPYYVYEKQGGGYAVSDQMSGAETASFYQVDGTQIEKYVPCAPLFQRDAPKTGPGVQKCLICGQFMGADHACDLKDVKSFGWEKTREWALGQDTVRGNNHTFMAAHSLLNGKYEEVIKDIDRGRLTRDEAVQVIDRLWENGAIQENERYTFTERIDRATALPSPSDQAPPALQEYLLTLHSQHNGQMNVRFQGSSLDDVTRQAHTFARQMAETYQDAVSVGEAALSSEGDAEPNVKRLDPDEFEAMRQQGRIGRNNGQMYGLYTGDDGDTVWGPVEIAFPAASPGSQKCPKCGQFMGEDHVCPATTPPEDHPAQAAHESAGRLSDYIDDPDDQPAATATATAGTLGDYIDDPDNPPAQIAPQAADALSPPRRVVPDDEWEQVQQAAMDWKYLTISAGGMARKSDLDEYLMAQFNLTDGAARSVSNALDEFDHIVFTDGGVRWDAEAAGRPVPQWADHPELAPPGRMEGAKRLQKCPKCGQFAGDDHTCPAADPSGNGRWDQQVKNAMSRLGFAHGELPQTPGQHWFLSHRNGKGIVRFIREDNGELLSDRGWSLTHQTEKALADIKRGLRVTADVDKHSATAFLDQLQRFLQKCSRCGQFMGESHACPLADQDETPQIAPPDTPRPSKPVSESPQSPAPLPPEPASVSPQPPVLHPLSELKLTAKAGWSGNKLEEGELIADGFVLLLAEAIKTPALRAKLAKPDQGILPRAQHIGQQIFSETSEAAQTPAELYGYLATSPTLPDGTALLVSAEGQVICVDAYKLARLSAAVDYDRMTVAVNQPAITTFWKDDRAVALLMPLIVPEEIKPKAEALIRQRKGLDSEASPGPGSQKCPQCGQFMDENHVCPVTDVQPAASAPVTAPDEALPAVEAALDTPVAAPAGAETAAADTLQERDEDAAAPDTDHETGYGDTPGRSSAFDYLPEGMDIPTIGATAEIDNPNAVLKFVMPGTGWTWYATESDGHDLCFGLVKGLDTDWGYFSLSELASTSGPMGAKIERDMRFKPQPIKQLVDYRRAFGDDAPASAEDTLPQATQVEVQAEQVTPTPMGVQKCPKCGQFMGDDHVCPTLPALGDGPQDLLESEVLTPPTADTPADDPFYVPDDPPVAAEPGGPDYTIGEADELGKGSAKEKARNNVAAVRLVKQLEAEGRMATPEEQAILVKFVGWGGLSNVFNDYRNSNYRYYEDNPGRAWSKPQKPDFYDEWKELKGLMTEEEWEAAAKSTLNAHYTSPTVVRGVWKALKQMGFDRFKGNVIEPAAGIGHFFGLMPDEFKGMHKLGVELDAFTARIARHLYQGATIHNSGFEDTNLPDHFFDLAISNVPFGNYGVTDKEFRGPLRFLSRSIHNFFFAKSLRKVKPGGVVAFITSRYTLDGQDPAIRAHLAKEADLVGAIRLPNTAFKENAGTEVTTDIIFLRKRGKGEPPSDTAWVNTQPVTGADGSEIRLNDYFAAHPEMMLGNLTTRGSMYAKGEVTLESDGRDLSTALDEAIAHLPGDALKAPAGHCPQCGGFLDQDGQCHNPNCHSKQPLTKTPRLADRQHKENEYVVKDGQLFRVAHGQLLAPEDDTFDEVDENSGKRKKPKRDAKTVQRIQGMVAINAAARKLLALNVNQADEAVLQAAQAELSQVYDAFVAQHGCIATDANKRALKNDPNLPFLLALEEDYDSHTKTARKAAIFSKRTIAIHKVVEHADSPADALRVTLSEGGVIHWDRMAQLTGKPSEHLQRALRLQKAVFETPEGGWQTAAEYLSGNVRQKLKQAQAAAAIDPRYRLNVESLEQVIPRDLEAGEIKVRLGSAWIPPEDVAAFASHLLKANFEVDYNPTQAEWSVQPSKKVSGKRYWTRAGEFDPKSAANTEIWAGGRGSGLDLLKKTLNAQQATYYDEVTGPDGKKSRTMNQEATLAAREMQAKIAKEFEQWLFSDPERTERLLRQYNDAFNAEVPRDFDGSHLTLPGLGATMPQLRQHQLDNIWRITQGDNVLLAHMVGAGKTFTMIGGGMELRRMGVRKKVMYTVPNHMLEQFAADIYRMYPAANVLALGVDDLTPEKRAETMSRVATGDYDAIVVTHSAFGKIPVSAETQTRYLREQLNELDAALEDLKANSSKEDSDRITVKKMEKAKAKLEDKIKNMQATVAAHQDNTINWDDLGVDQLFVDEADLFKNLDFPTRRNISGVKGAASQRAFDMYTKIRSMGDRFGHGKGVCFATGTPIANSVSEMYNMQRYLDHHHLVDQNLAHFDAWANQFGESVTAIEMKPSGGGYQTKERFAQFNNVPELKRMYMRFADIRVDPHELKLPRPQIAADEKGERRQRGVVAPASPELKDYIADLVKRADNLSQVSPREDNMLKITGDGRKAALDMRLVNPLADDDPNSKLNQCVASVLDIYKDTTGVEVEGLEGRHNMAQIVFCDLGTPAARERGEFCVYDDIKQKLTARGLPANEIAFMQDCKNDEEKFELFQKVNSGQVRVLIGSTETMGSGMNAQRRMAALHHLDAPWRPRDIEQREGRILRQGNLNKEVKIHRYLTEGSFDVYNWQLLERKQRFISQVMNRSLNERSVEDIDSQALTYAEMKALATGNPAVIEKVAVDTELRKLEALEKAHKSSAHSVRLKLEKLPKDIAASRAVLDGAQKAHAAITQAREAETQHEARLKAEIEQARAWAREAVAKAKEQDTPENRQQAESARQAYEAQSERFKRNGAFRLRLNGRDYTEKDQAGRALASIEGELILQGGGGDHVVGETLGFPLIARAPQDRGGQCHFYVKFTPQDARPVPFDTQTARTFDASAEGGDNVTRLRRALAIPEQDIKLHQNQIATWTSELETLQRASGGAFEHADRLGQLRQRAQELDEIMAQYGGDRQVLEGNDAEAGE